MLYPTAIQIHLKFFDATETASAASERLQCAIEICNFFEEASGSL